MHLYPVPIKEVEINWDTALGGNPLPSGSTRFPPVQIPMERQTMTESPVASLTDFRGRGFIRASDAPIAVGIEDMALIRVSRKKRREDEWKDVSGEPRPPQPCDRAGASRPLSAVCAAHAEFVAVLAGHPPRPIPLDADAIDLEDRAAHLSKVFGSLSAYLAVILDDIAQNVPGRLDLPNVEAHLADLAADVTGLIEHAAEDMRGWIA